MGEILATISAAISYTFVPYLGQLLSIHDLLLITCLPSHAGQQQKTMAPRLLHAGDGPEQQGGSLGRQLVIADGTLTIDQTIGGRLTIQHGPVVIKAGKTMAAQGSRTHHHIEERVQVCSTLTTPASHST
jgi:hypothetical protein